MENGALCLPCFSIFHPTAEVIDCETSNRFAKKGVLGVTMKWHPSPQAVDEAAKEGCKLCKELRMEISALQRPTEQQWPSVESFSVRLRYEDFGGYSSYALLSGKMAPDGWSGWILEFQAHLSGGILAFGHRYLYSAQEEYALRETKVSPHGRDLALAEQWMSECRHEHHLCASGDNNVLPEDLPSRLVHIWQESGSIRAKLVEREAIKSSLQYVSLSHRWGEQAMCKLQKNNRLAWTRGINTMDLPQTFQDAFVVAFSLGFRYFWIDSLCIMQHSEDDWAREVWCMADIYERAALNIAATASECSHTGLFFQKGPHQAQMLTLPVNVQYGDMELQGDYRIVSKIVWSSLVDKSPLNRRGWVQQERFFSNRILHFSASQLLWECQEKQASETIPSLADLRIDSIHKRGYRSYRAVLDEAQRDREYGDFYVRVAWYRLIESYTACELTFVSDRLPAVTGMMNKFAELLSDQCIHGLWKKRLCSDLLWSRPFSDAEAYRHRLATSHTPTWSWLSVDGPVQYLAQPWNLEVEFSLRNSHASDDILTQRLQLCAPLLKAVCSPQASFSAQSHTTILRGLSLGLRLTLDGCPGDSDNCYISPEEKDVLMSEMSTLSPARDGHGRSVSSLSTWVHLIFILDKPFQAGLVLKRTHEQGTYSRIGYFDFSWPEPESQRPADEHWSELWRRTYPMERSDYHESHGDGIYSVTIV